MGATLERLNDDHAPAATGTGLRERRHLAVIGIGGFGFWRDDAEQLAGPGDVGGAPAIGEQAPRVEPGGRLHGGCGGSLWAGRG